MVLYGEPVEQEMATSQDPVVSKVWHEKEVAEFDPFPYKRVYEILCFNPYVGVGSAARGGKRRTKRHCGGG